MYPEWLSAIQDAVSQYDDQRRCYFCCMMSWSNAFTKAELALEKEEFDNLTLR